MLKGQATQSNSAISTMVKIIALIGAIAILIPMLMPSIRGLAATMGFDISAGTADAYDACVDFNAKFFTFDSFEGTATKSAKSSTSIANDLTPFIGSQGTSEERWNRARVFCGATLGIVKGVDSGNLEHVVDDINELYEKYGAKFDASEISEIAQNSRKKEWTVDVMNMVSSDFNLMETTNIGTINHNSFQ